MLDYSAINYCVESYVFTQWFNTLDLEVNALLIGEDNDPEKEDSPFTQHKRDVIKRVIEDNLQQAITSYSRNTAGSNFYLPVLLETDWDKILNNVSIITFLQDIPIGLKYYNNYTIATSTLNNEFVDPNEIYLNVPGDNYYHMPYCTELSDSDDLIGYRNTDYVQKTDDTTKQFKSDNIKRFYRHYDENGEDSKGNAVTIRANEKCYYCLIERAKYNPNGGKTEKKEKAYYTALARERYIAKKGRLPAQVPPSYVIIAEAYNETLTSPVSGKVYIREGISGSFENISSKKIDKDNIPITYTIKGESDGLGGSPILKKEIGNLSSISENDIVTNEEYLVEVQEGDGGLYTVSPYSSEDVVDINIIQYDDTAVQATYLVTDGNPNVTTTGTNSGNLITMGGDEDGEIRVKLKYTSNFNPNGANGAYVWANIDSDTQLTIVTEPKDEHGNWITGKIRLRFTNTGTGKVYYTKQILEVVEGSKIACKISDPDKSWRENNWHVDVLTTNNTVIVGGDVQYYTFNTAEGLRDFASATNDGTKQAITAGRKFYLINDIENVGNMDPINKIDATEYTWFDGYFSGKDHSNVTHKITNITINNEDGQEAYGLFGRLGSPSIVENLEINNIKILIDENKATTFDEDGNKVITSDIYKNQYVGGLAGYAANGERISGVTVSDSEIQGTTCIGGIIGLSKKTITGVKLENTNVKSIIVTSKWLEHIFVGGLVGKLEQNSVGGSVNNSQIGNEDAKVKSRTDPLVEWFNHGRNKYYVGGIVGYTASGTSVDSSSNIESNCNIYRRESAFRKE